jgi:hypothetical protein
MGAGVPPPAPGPGQKLDPPPASWSAGGLTGASYELQKGAGSTPALRG